MIRNNLLWVFGFRLGVDLKFRSLYAEQFIMYAIAYKFEAILKRLYTWKLEKWRYCVWFMPDKSTYFSFVYLADFNSLLIKRKKKFERKIHWNAYTLHSNATQLVLVSPIVINFGKGQMVLGWLFNSWRQGSEEKSLRIFKIN